jgi:hypothetical protein
MAKAAVLHDWQGVAQNSAKLVAAPSARRGGFFEQEFVDEVDTAAKLADFDIVLSMRERTPTVPPSWLRYGRGKYIARTLKKCAPLKRTMTSHPANSPLSNSEKLRQNGDGVNRTRRSAT